MVKDVNEVNDRRGRRRNQEGCYYAERPQRAAVVPDGASAPSPVKMDVAAPKKDRRGLRWSQGASLRENF